MKHKNSKFEISDLAESHLLSLAKGEAVKPVSIEENTGEEHQYEAHIVEALAKHDFTLEELLQESEANEQSLLKQAKDDEESNTEEDSIENMESDEESNTEEDSIENMESDEVDQFIKSRRKQEEPEVPDETQDDSPEMSEESVESDEDPVEEASNDIARLVNSEEGLTEAFKAKAALIFETAVRTKVEEATALLESEYNDKLAKEIETVTETLATQVDEYLTYAVEEWIKENKVAVESSLRSSIAENFMSSLKALFVENYVEVPESKVDLFNKLEEETAQLKEDLAKSNRIAETLAKRVDSLNREKILGEATKDLAETQSAKLRKLAEGVEFNEEFSNKVTTLKEFYFSGKSTPSTESIKAQGVTVETIVEGAEETAPEPQLSRQMASYMQTLSRLKKSAT